MKQGIHSRRIACFSKMTPTMALKMHITIHANTNIRKIKKKYFRNKPKAAPESKEDKTPSKPETEASSENKETGNPFIPFV